ncbi:VWA domain-containing protein [Mangrovimonas spongiae]|uniref:VWA domain-containing protein n=1 Tax=Mangrovimonas spongiae TaxID=2494697 RepID=A0A3R9NVR4_9FLAO|nr:VWA domain-containing protein [Mangrovimonas spongiae]RSK38692.1 VWA domain-containing protein [Mangrovimonas spongiae]
MNTETLLYIILSGVIALLLALFQYKYRSKTKNIFLTFLRFLSLFAIFILLVNPKIETKQTYIQKPSLAIVLDNSNSINYFKQETEVKQLLSEVKSRADLSRKFNIDYFTFGKTLSKSDSLTFSEKQSNISDVFTQLQQIYTNQTAPTILVTDGNQTFGSDYSFVSKNYNQVVYPVVVGDTTAHSDLKIQQLNTNKYAYLKNKFPVEAIVVYHGQKNISTTLTVKQGDAVIFTKPLSFSKENTSDVVTFYLPANKVGVQTYKVHVNAITGEKNTLNNTKNFAVEVIDEKTKVAIVSSITHPDIGAIKKSIETNEQRQCDIISPGEFIARVNDYQLAILYQPDSKFKPIINALKQTPINTFIIAGTKTNWQLLNSENLGFKHDINNQTEAFQAQLNPSYSNFIIEDLAFSSFPPLKGVFGDISFEKNHSILLYKQIGNVITESPLLVTTENNGARNAVLLGENIWQWRAQSYLNSSSFNTFDNFTGKLIQYLASKKRKDRLVLDYNSFYEGSTQVILKAQYFNKNYEFDAREKLHIRLTNKKTQETFEYPLVLKNNYFEVNLSNLPPADYDFTVKTANSNLSKSASFKILAYNIEQQFLNADVTKLSQIATNSKGNLFFSSNYKLLFNNLLKDERFKPIQKTTKTTLPLINWKYLLAFIVFCLSLEWFIRKYKGLI